MDGGGGEWRDVPGGGGGGGYGWIWVEEPMQLPMHSQGIRSRVVSKTVYRVDGGGLVGPKTTAAAAAAVKLLGGHKYLRGSSGGVCNV